jgi:putative membrane protein
LGGYVGVAYLGTHGDPWAAQQDMYLALLGSFAAVAALAAAGRRRRGPRVAGQSPRADGP